MFPKARVGGGTLAYFTELTRNRPPAALLDFVTHGFAANIHAADEISIMETLETIPHIARSLRGFMPDKPYRIGFASIAMRVSPYGAGPVPNPEGRRVAASRIDPRQRGLVAASWALGFTACASREGIESVALGMPLGPFGLVETSETTDFRLRPIFAVVEALCAAAGHPRRDVAISDPGRVQALAFERGDRLELRLVNLGAEPITVEIEGFTATAMRRLGPYAIAAISGSE